MDWDECVVKQKENTVEKCEEQMATVDAHIANLERVKERLMDAISL